MIGAGLSTATRVRGRARNLLSTAMVSLFATAAFSLPATPPTTYEVPASIRTSTGLGWYSANWAGYVVDHGPYRSAAQYSAWWEVLPAPAVRIRSLAVRPGDRMTARIERVGTNRWRITISDARGGSYTTVRAYAGPGTSAEWIEEAPVVGWRTAALATHGSTAFDNATVNGTDPRLIAADGGAMIRGDLLVEVPSRPDRDGNGFTLSQQGTAPAPPVS